MSSVPDQDEPSLADTLALIQRLHADQTDWSGAPYWHHPLAVMERLPVDATMTEKLAALLHDVLEDTPTTADDLRQHGYSDDVVGTVIMLSRTPDSGSYMEWVRSIAASGNRAAIRVKIADNEHNSDPVRITQLPPEAREKAEQMATNRYRRSLAVLRRALEA
jgi:(p)ppGpp synthase/HD superfamily hydrolase